MHGRMYGRSNRFKINLEGSIQSSINQVGYQLSGSPTGPQADTQPDTQVDTGPRTPFLVVDFKKWQCSQALLLYFNSLQLQL